MLADNSTNLNANGLVTIPSSKTNQFTKRAIFSSSSFLMNLLPHRRRQSELVKRTSFVLDDYANLLSRDSHFLSNSDSATVTTTASCSINESPHDPTTGGSTVATPCPSVVSVASVGSFQRNEVSLGALLGKGSFSKVYEITSIALDDNNNNNNNHRDNSTIVEDDAMTDFDAVASARARAAMLQNAREGKYAMKRLRKKLLRHPRDFTRAAANLVIEAQILSKLDHPNIIKLRGAALGGASSFQSGEHDGYFLILDILRETLEERIYKAWSTARNSNRLDEAELLHQKTHYALQLASALQHLHERRLIFRDLKPQNMGFTGTDAHTLQLYDFGLCRELPSALGLTNELFHMTLCAGSKPYMAVEVATTGLYNLKADVYSWSMVVYEIMAEQVPFVHLAAPKSKKPFSNREFLQAVYIDEERPSFDTEQAVGTAPKVPPPEIQDLLAKCWQSDLFHRPHMKDVHAQLNDIVDHLPRTNIKDLEAEVPPMVLEAQQQQTQQRRSSFTDVSDISRSNHSSTAM